VNEKSASTDELVSSEALGVVSVVTFTIVCGRSASTRDRLLIGVLTYRLIVGNIIPITMDSTLPMYLLLFAPSKSGWTSPECRSMARAASLSSSPYGRGRRS